MTYSPGPNRLTPAARRVLQAIHDLSERLGFPPTLREIAEAARLRSISTVSSHVTTLHRLGLVKSYPGMPCGTYITDQGRSELGKQATFQDVLSRLREARDMLRALDGDRIDEPHTWAAVALEDILEHLEVPA